YCGRFYRCATAHAAADSANARAVVTWVRLIVLLLLARLLALLFAVTARCSGTTTAATHYLRDSDAAAGSLTEDQTDLTICATDATAVVGRTPVQGSRRSFYSLSAG
ncbi:hypothetical protein Dimus_030288, partial [Dionaea muscipula]